MKAWTYNGRFPGPWIKVNVGDKVRVVLDNKLPQSTVIHFHGIEVPNAMDGVPDVTQAPIKPGENVHLRVRRQEPRARHVPLAPLRASSRCPTGCSASSRSATSPLPAGHRARSRNRCRWCLNDAGVIGLSLNGKSFPATAPVIAHVGDWVEINYFNEGLQIHPMHLHGLPQLVIAKDGFPLPQPYTVDTISVAPG